MNIQEINIRLIKSRNGLIGFASCVINDSWFIGNLAVYKRFRVDGYRIVYPQHKLPNGHAVDLFHPISKEAGAAIESAISKKLDTLFVFE